jgi:hypothetical protein
LIVIHELIHELTPDGAEDAGSSTGAERSFPANPQSTARIFDYGSEG